MTSEAESKLTKEDLEHLLNTAIKDFEATNLTEAGDNNGSVMLAVNVTLRTGKVIYLVAKMYPQDPITIQVFNSPLSMRKEIDMYLVVVPEFQRIQEDYAIPPPRRLDVFCTCVAARATRRPGVDDGTRLADQNAIILLENLKVMGFSSTDRIAGMDLSHAVLVVSQLAKFHATGVALKMTKPLLFRNKITRVLTPIKTRLDDREFETKMKMGYVEALCRQSPVCEEHLAKLEKIFGEELEFLFTEGGRPPLEPYATIVHNDLWTNNIMFRYKPHSTDNIPVAVRFVDFQLPSYGSPVSDLLFFLFTSVNEEVLVDSLDYLLKLYHEIFVEWLVLLGCTIRKFSWDSFTKELNIFSLLELPHILGMLNVTMLNKEDAEHMSTDPRENHNGPVELNDNIVQRATQIVTIFSDKGWL